MDAHANHNLSCDDVNARLVDLVYGDGPVSARQALEAHVGGCARCQADLEALGRTRATVRARLDDAPPPSARARLMAAAAAAVAPAAAAAKEPPASTLAATTSLRPRATAPARPSSPAPSLWERWKQRWTLPTFATIGAMAVAVFAFNKVFLNPEKTLERGQEIAAQSAPPSSPVGAAGPRELGSEQPAPPAAEQPAAPAPPPAGLVDRDDRFADKRAESDEGAAPAANELLERSRRLRRAPGQRQVPFSARPLMKEERPMGLPSAGAFAPPPPPRVAGNKDVAREEPAAVAIDREQAAPKAKAAASPARSGGLMRKQDLDQALGGLGSGSSLGGSPAAAAAPAPAMDDLVPAERDDRRESTVEKRESTVEKKASKKGAADSSAATAEELARRADQLYAARRWDEAAAAYEELIRRFPGSTAAVRWRTRVASARRAVAPAPTAATAARAAPAPAQAPAAAAKPAKSADAVMDSAR